MELRKLKLLVENELYPLVLANSQDELAKITLNTTSRSIIQFTNKYKEELTDENIDYLTEYIWNLINKKQKDNNLLNKEER